MVESLTSPTAITVRILFTMTRQAHIVAIGIAIVAYEKMSMTVMSVAQRYGVAMTMIVMTTIIPVQLFTVTDTSLTLSSLAQAHTTWALS
jgi:hypothetical protein